jgi:hypothetical protein
MTEKQKPGRPKGKKYDKLTPDIVKGWFCRYFDETGELPTANDRVIEYDSSGRVWHRLTSYIKRSCDKTFVEFRDEVLGVKKPAITNCLVVEWINRYYTDNGKAPRSSSRLVKYADFSVQWCSVDAFLRKNHKVGLTDYAHELLGVWSRKMTTTLITRCISSYYLDHGRSPWANRDTVPGDVHCRTWGTVNRWLTRNENTTLSEFATKVTGWRSPHSRNRGLKRPID